VKGVRRLGVRLGHWLTAEQGRRLLRTESPPTLRGLRDYAMVALLLPERSGDCRAVGAGRTRSRRLPARPGRVVSEDRFVHRRR
jgi:hypothetical protein